VSVAVLLVLSHVCAAMIGGVLGYLLGRPPRRRSSVELSVDGATRQAGDGTTTAGKGAGSSVRSAVSTRAFSSGTNQCPIW
jgi:hypothetical protein